MTSKISERKLSLLRGVGSLALAGASMILPGQAYAQVEPLPVAGATEQAEEERGTETIVITGSRIRRPELTSEQPMSIVQGEIIDDRGYNTIAQALNDLPAVGTPESPRGRQGAAVGRNFVNLFNLGSQRTLTLVNGRRFVTSNAPSADATNPGNQVDLNNIPSALIDRVEIVQATGAATYGSDAIAGVVNILLKENFNGLELDGQYSITARGDAPAFRIQATAGTNFADNRGNVVISYEHSESDGLLNADRVFGRGFSYFPNPLNTSNTDGIPNTLLLCCRIIQEATLGGIPFASLANRAYTSEARLLADIITMPGPNGTKVAARFAPDGTLVPYDYGKILTSGGAVGGEGFDTSFFQNLLSPVKRDVVYGTGRFALNDSVTVFAEAMHSWVDADELARQGSGINAALNGPGSPTSVSGALPMSIDNPFLSAQAKSIIAGQGLSSFFLSRYNADLLPDSSAQHVSIDTYRVVLGLEGDFTWGDRDFYWNVAANRGVSKGENRDLDVHVERFFYAIDAVRAPNGNIVCRVTLQNPGSSNQSISQCQPLNLFGQGAPSAAARDYITVELERNYELSQNSVQANLGGELFRLPGGDLSFSAGYEYRREKVDYNVNEALRQGIARSGRVSEITGAYSTNELYGELLIPLVGGDFTLPLVQSLELQGAARYVDSTQTGKDHAWNVGARWKVIDDILFRGSFSRTFRAPSALELFLPRQGTSQTAGDPCDFRNINLGFAVATRQANCQAMLTSFGQSQPFTSQAVLNSVLTTVGGNPDLKNEVAESWTAGVVLQPRFIPGLTLTADYVNIDIRDAIVQFNGTSILVRCFDDPNPDPEICGLVRRDNSAQIVEVTSGYVNAGYTKFSGISLAADYVLPLNRLSSGLPGTLRLNVNALHTRRLETSVSGLGFDLDIAAGEFNAPKWKGQFTATYRSGPVMLSWFTHYVGPAVINVLDTPETRFPLGAGSYFRHDFSFRFNVTDRFSFRAGIYNMFDREPALGTQSIGGSFTNGGSTDILGRSFFAGANVKF